MDVQQLKIAVFIDFDNIEIGVKNTLNAQFDAGLVLEALKERGEVVSKIAYSDWKRAGDYSRVLAHNAIKMVQRNLTPGGDKNGADINLALDALEMAFTHHHINAYVIVGGDSDFISLVEKLKQYDKKVFVVGGRQFTSAIMQKNCHEFIAYENLLTTSQPRHAAQARGSRAPQQLPIDQVFPLVRRALQVLSDREVTPQLGLLKSTLLQLDSTFSERDYGAGSFRDFADKLAAAGLVQLKHAGRNVLVELPESGAIVEAEGSEAAAPPRADADAVRAEAPRERDEPGGAPATPPPTDTLPLAEGIKQVEQVFQQSAGLRWPMYIRNVKQHLRAANGGFDERRYGVGGIVELLRACQREGVFRLERDRKGVMRVFPGPRLSQRPVNGELAVEQPAQPRTEDYVASGFSRTGPSDVRQIDEREDARPMATREPGNETSVLDAEVVDEVNGNVAGADVTASLLGEVKPGRRPRAASAAPRPRKPAATAPRAPRVSKPRTRKTP